MKAFSIAPCWRCCRRIAGDRRARPLLRPGPSAECPRTPQHLASRPISNPIPSCARPNLASTKCCRPPLSRRQITAAPPNAREAAIHLLGRASTSGAGNRSALSDSRQPRPGQSPHGRQRRASPSAQQQGPGPACCAGWTQTSPAVRQEIINLLLSPRCVDPPFARWRQEQRRPIPWKFLWLTGSASPRVPTQAVRRLAPNSFRRTRPPPARTSWRNSSPPWRSPATRSMAARFSRKTA